MFYLGKFFSMNVEMKIFPSETSPIPSLPVDLSYTNVQGSSSSWNKKILNSNWNHMTTCSSLLNLNIYTIIEMFSVVTG